MIKMGKGFEYLCKWITRVFLNMYVPLKNSCIYKITKFYNELHQCMVCVNNGLWELNDDTGAVINVYLDYYLLEKDFGWHRLIDYHNFRLKKTFNSVFQCKIWQNMPFPKIKWQMIKNFAPLHFSYIYMLAHHW